MDIRHLRYFIAIVDSGSLSEASRRLHIVQPALSQRLSSLEEELGVQLLVRGRSGVAVTDAGAELYQRAKNILKQLDLTKDAVLEKAGTMRGKVSIGMLRTVASVMGARLFLALKSELPDITPELVVGYSAELKNRLNSMRLDLAMQVYRPDTASEHGIHLFRERLYLVSPRSIFDPQQPVKLADLEAVPLLLSSMQPFYGFLIDAAREAGVDLSIVGGIEDGAAVLDVCRAGVACTVVPEIAAQRIEQDSGLSVTVIDNDHLHREIRLESHPDIPKTGAMMAVERVVARVVSDFLASRQ